ncbi:MAG: preprotein translocase subunit SecG [Zunongwangia sp.]|jgi:preprotein translocase subunit SecG|nr:preprotein translocase subunit SecG [Zunongwangia profunda]MAC65813.1 preprotein translocase subunit SecG [Flavobacteriaceae bacterium]MAO35379.1 preprotein translocase subunit SecG [Zunongwangia sp.]MAS71232.1 preprotein translocase subunit SecG [Zunongwangia sp.]MCC4227077.1 preprotein translocase subunit SecG [Zunongwangia profunda]HCV82505.1 preprotein translocase subunit SecG [Zunongwangia profunda]|tara:strand:- start:1343 stop:1708 length:366 start_codon:yes stop_codon:yes gene_type:complete
MSTFTIFLVLIVIVAFLLVVVIMVQNPKGGGLSSSLGGGGQQIGGVQKTNDFLDKSTWTLATALLVLILISNVSIMDGNNGFGDSKIFDEDEVENALPEATPAPAQQNEQTQTAPAADSAQ